MLPLGTRLSPFPLVLCLGGSVSMSRVESWVARDLLVVYVVLWLLQLWVRRERRRDPRRVIMNERLGWLFIAVYSIALVGLLAVNYVVP